MSRSFESGPWNACMHKLDLGLYSGCMNIIKELWWRGLVLPHQQPFVSDVHVLLAGLVVRMGHLAFCASMLSLSVETYAKSFR